MKEALLEHVARYRLTTIDVTSTLFYSHLSHDAARKALRRLVEDGWLQTFEVANRSFYFLSPKACRVFGLPQSAARPPGQQAIYERYAVLSFATFSDGSWVRLTPMEFGDAFPSIANLQGVNPSSQNYLIDRQREGRLYRAAVDMDADAGRAVRKCRSILRDVSKTPGLRDLLRLNRFSLLLLTAEASKASSLRLALARGRIADLTDVIPVPELVHLRRTDVG